MGGPHCFEEETNQRNKKVQTSLFWYLHGWNDGFDFLVVSCFPLYPSQNHKDQNADSIQNSEEHSMRKYLFMSFQPRLCASHLCPMLTNTGPCPFLALLVLPREKAMAPLSTTLASEIPWMEEPGGLQSMGSRRVGHDWAPSLSLFTFMRWRRKWQPTPVFLPGESWGREPGGLPSMGSHRVGHDRRDLAAATAVLPHIPKF